MNGVLNKTQFPLKNYSDKLKSKNKQIQLNKNVKKELNKKTEKTIR